MSENQQFTSIFEAKVVSFIEAQNLLNASKKYLVGISGGPDSTALSIFLSRKGYKIGLVHCNFQLRGKDADDDEAFVKSLAERLNVPFYVEHFDTQKEKANSDESIQMVARRLRYNYFDELIKKHNYSAIIVGTTLNDQLETVLLNLTKGTGISGLSGIQPRNKNVLRPFLNITKTEILNYLEALNEPFRNDDSNQENKYQRNLIRNKVIPELQKINPSIYDSLKNTLAFLRDDELAGTFAVNEALKKCSSEEEGKLYINIENLLSFSFYKKILWTIAQQYGFSSDQALAIEQLLFAESGKKVAKENFVCLKDRTHLLFFENEKIEEKELLINSIPFSNTQFSIKKTEHPKNLKTPPHQIYLNGDAIKLPLKLRTWQQGDKIIPFGMNGQKLVSDILIDQKLSLLEKQNQLILENGDGKIIWVLGLKFSEEFKVTSKTREVIIVEK